MSIDAFILHASQPEQTVARRTGPQINDALGRQGYIKNVRNNANTSQGIRL
jgi:hypothetical protein